MRRASLWLAVASALALAGCEFPQDPAPRPEDTASVIAAPLQASNAEAAKLYRVVETYFNDYLALNPVFASSLGDRRFDDRFGDYASASWMADSLGIEQESLERLARVNPRNLQGDDLVTYEAFKRQRETSIYGYRFPSELLALTPVNNPGVLLARLASGDGAHPFRTTQDYDHFLARMDGFVAWTEQITNNLRAGVSKGIVLPKVVVERTLPQLETFARIQDPRQSVFWQPLLNFPPGPTVADRHRLIRAYDEKLRTQVIPAYRRLHDYLAKEYLPAARNTVSWSDLPGGEYWYAWLVRHHTSTDMKPDEVHELGLREVARVRANLANLQPALGVGGDVHALLDAMRTDPKFRADAPASLVPAYRGLARRVEASLPELFDRKGTAAWTVRPIEDFRSASSPWVLYEAPSADGSRPATLYLNTSASAAPPTFLLEPLALREAFPGRHYQRALAQGAPNLPSFRRYVPDDAFTDGWALYAESLGGQLGLLSDPYAQFGALADDLLQSALLVVDTGLHAKGWTRERAIDYLRANSALREAEIAAEVDRCIAAPGAALAYKVGELKILELRRKAEQALGGRFDLRAFHAQVVERGALPLPVLEAKIDRWIVQQKSQR